MSADVPGNECPARCKWSGLCHGLAFFKGKSGRPVKCPGDCSYRREWQAKKDALEKEKDRPNV